MKGLVRAIMRVGLMCASAPVFASTLEVGPDAQYRTISAAITAAISGDIINVAPSTYVENITLKSGVTLIGAETARTFLQAATVSKPVITVESVTRGRISWFTFIDSPTGIQVSGGSAVTIAANVFNLGTNGTAIKVTATADSSLISNNTFYSNQLAVSRAGSGTVIQNNIFASNTTAIASTDVPAGISFNFFSDLNNNQTGTNAISGSDPLFVNAGAHDFHLKAGSAAINTGSPTDTDLIDRTQADLGAYGGQYADPKPYPVQNVTIVDSTSPPATPPLFSLTLSWAANQSYLIDSYAVQFELVGSSQNVVNFGPTPTPGTSPQNVGNVLSVTLSGSAFSVADSVEAPVLNSIEPQSQALKLKWSPVSNATGYEVHYGLASTNEKTEVVGNVNSLTLTNLQNRMTYLVAVVAVWQPVLHAAVAAQGSTLAKNTNDYSVSQVTRLLGDAKTSSSSNILTGIPEEVVPFPALPNEGCFIATAAYGSDSAAQVKTLRDFRDHYLLTNTPGRAFVSWYYANSPPAAHYLNQHPALKPVVRGLLLPFVFITRWINNPSLEMQVAVIALVGITGLGFYWRRRRTSWA